jgi:predicted RNase H-like HicB family nuclease
MLVVSLIVQCIFLLGALIFSAKLTLQSHSIVTGGLWLYALIVLWVMLFSVIIPGVLVGAGLASHDVVDAFPEATGVVPVVLLYWVPAFIFAGLVRRFARGANIPAGGGTLPRFEDYSIQAGYTNVGHVPYASIEEFFSLVATGSTHEQAVENLRKRFEERVSWMIGKGEPIPRPGSGRAKPKFAPNEQIEALRPFVDEFWSEILGTCYATSFVSNESRLSTWEQYVPGGKSALIQKIKDRYGVDITAFYDAPIPDVLGRIQQGKSDANRS